MRCTVRDIRQLRDELYFVDVYFIKDKPAVRMYFQVDFWTHHKCNIVRPVIIDVEKVTATVVSLEMEKPWAKIVTRKLIQKYGLLRVLNLRKVKNMKKTQALFELRKA